MANETKYVVISEDYLRRIVRGFAGNDSMTDACMVEIQSNSIPAQELWDAALIEMAARMANGKYGREPKLMPDFLTSKFPNND